MLNGLRVHVFDPIRGFNRPVRLFLATVLIYGVILSAWQLFFNFYILQSGYGREFLGLANSLPSAAALVFGIPLGRLSDRIGGRASVILGIVLSSVFMLAQVTVKDRRLIAGAAFLFGAFYTLFIVSEAPLMTRLSKPENRTMLFSLSFGLQTFAGAIGALFAGQLPGFFGSVLHVEAHGATAYQAVLILSVLLGTTSILPMWRVEEPKAGPARTRVQPPQELRAGPTSTRAVRKSVSPLWTATARMTAPQILIGFGAAILIPYLNVFFKYRFSITDSLLGVLFSISSLLVGIGSLLAPRLSTILSGKIRAVVATQISSLVFLLMLGFAPFLWMSSLGFLARTVLMNMSAPLYSAFCMERTPEERQGFVNSVLNLSWNLGWAVGPFISGVIQEQYGFGPLFIATTALYAMASTLTWIFFNKAERGGAPRTTILQSLEYPE
jgi:MFS family permease